ncbi:MAG TPA: glycosyltransferase N-terminal domain-containing protein [Chitinophagales bacterium]|nr:glycosyltransferase N-terminal domain-containing protein [Chitinophagales bacterium]HRK26919.1 glycosyltransferase N-terminal domain-containing protein [Chitinophagales bacterium]
MFFTFIYRLFTFFYVCAIHAAALFVPKAALWVKGRRQIWQTIAQSMAALPPTGKRVWVHCASLGEFEQGRPIIETLKQQVNGVQIILTFYSPSGFEVRKNYPFADAVFYLPPDSPRNAQRWLAAVKPTLAVFVKYEFWLFYLSALHGANIPVALVSAIFRPNQAFFRWYGIGFRRVLRYYRGIFVQDRRSVALLCSIGVNQTILAPDTRFDRVLATASQAINIPIAANFAAGRRVVVCGSTWTKDEQLLQQVMLQAPPDVCFMIAPHEVTPMRLTQLKSLLAGMPVVWYSTAHHQTPAKIADAKVMVIDNVGMLAQLYGYGTFAYVGGGFGAGIHNVLEAAVFGLPVFFGPAHHKFIEAVQLVQLGGAFVVHNAEQLSQTLFTLLANEEALRKASGICKQYVHENKGGTAIIMQNLMGWLSG